MATSKIECFILNTKEYSNTTTIIEVLSNNKVLTIFGRGFKNPKNRFHILNNRFIKLDVYGEESDEFFNIKDFDIIELNDRLMSNYNLNMQMNMINQLILQNKQIVSEQMYTLYDYTISELNDDNGFHLACIWLMYYYQALGKTSANKGCCHCNEENNIITYDFTSGGYVCSNCYNGEEIFDLEELRYISNLLNFKIDKILNSTMHIKIYMIMYNQLKEEEGYYLPMWEEYGRNIRSKNKR